MRISDWSSDVCSSDLARDHLEAEEARELELLPERPHRTPLTNARAAEGRRRGRAARAARQLRLIGAAAMLDAIGEAGIHRLAAEMEVGLARVPHRPAADAVVEVERSEEHTSELQSLMRISYAVFCLKKKKIQHA